LFTPGMPFILRPRPWDGFKFYLHDHVFGKMFTLKHREGEWGGERVWRVGPDEHFLVIESMIEPIGGPW
jgi:hypothetical protein